jgi:membrane protein DedA with SNARE-associated domain
MLEMDPLSALINWIAEYGLYGLLLLGIFERFVPILPSYGVLVAIGIAADEGAWSLIWAISGSVLGSLVGALILYRIVLSLREERIHRLLAWIGRMTGISAARIESSIMMFRKHQRGLSFGMQLVPSIRLISPVIAGLFRANGKAFALATMLGILCWNGLFILVGYAASTIAPDTNASALAIQVVVVLLVVELLLALIWRWYHVSFRKKA